MRRYETIFISRTDIPSETFDAVMDRYLSIIDSLEGKTVRIEKWGKRRLAYPIEKMREGVYTLINFVGESKIIDELERNFRIDDKILRFQTVKLSDFVDMDAVEKEIAAAKAKEQEAARESEGTPAENEEPAGETKEAGDAISGSEEEGLQQELMTEEKTGDE